MFTYGSVPSGLGVVKSCRYRITGDLLNLVPVIMYRVIFIYADLECTS